MNADALPFYIEPMWLVPILVAAWFVLCGLIAHLSGWASLARRFAADDLRQMVVANPVGGERFRFASGSLGRRYLPVNYNGCLFVTVSSEGLHLSILFLLRYLSPPLFIPWSSVGSVKSRSFLSFNHYTFTIRDHWSRIGLMGKAGESAKAAYDAVSGAQP